MEIMSPTRADKEDESSRRWMGLVGTLKYPPRVAGDLSGLDDALENRVDWVLSMLSSMAPRHSYCRPPPSWFQPCRATGKLGKKISLTCGFHLATSMG